MYKRIVNRGVVSAISLNQAKDQLNILNNLEDTHIGLLVDSATDLAERYTRRLFSVSDVEIVFYGKCKVELPYGEAQEPTKVTVNGDDVAFKFNRTTQYMILDSVIDDAAEVVVNYKAGYDGDVPHAVKMGVLMMLSSLYENREDTTPTTTSDIPLGSTAMLDAVKLRGLS